MNRYRKIVTILSLFSFFFITSLACAPAVIVKEPPAPKVETKTRKPFPNAVWIDGHWKWNSAVKDFVWISGHWAKPKPGKTWVAGYWKKTPRGWVRVKDHWR